MDTLIPFWMFGAAGCVVLWIISGGWPTTRRMVLRSLGLSLVIAPGLAIGGGGAAIIPATILLFDKPFAWLFFGFVPTVVVFGIVLGVYRLSIRRAKT